MLLTGADVAFPTGPPRQGWVRVGGARITAAGEGRAPAAEPGEEVRDLGGALLLPGFIDIHVHGGGGASLMSGDAAEVSRAVAYQRRNGTTRCLASLVTAPVEDLLAEISSLADLVEDGLLAGIHLEGPFLSDAHRGAQDRRFLLEPDLEILDRLLAAGRGTVRMMTLAPELDDAVSVVRRLADEGVLAALGHSGATYSQANAAIDAGARVATHLFNGMVPFHHREPGIVGAVLEREEVTCELICDPHHLHANAIRLASRLAGGRTAFVTDAISAAGADDGLYRVGPLSVRVERGQARIEGTETLAGSTISQVEALRFALREVGMPVEEAVRAASATPAGLLGIGEDLGSIEAGKLADLVALDAGLEVTAVLTAGEIQEVS